MSLCVREFRRRFADAPIADVTGIRIEDVFGRWCDNLDPDMVATMLADENILRGCLTYDALWMVATSVDADQPEKNYLVKARDSWFQRP